MTVRELLSEVDCRVEHGAESGGLLEYVRERLREIVTTLDEAVESCTCTDMCGHCLLVLGERI